MKLISPADLHAAASQAHILDVRLADDFECCHIPGAANNCVYEVAFHERLKDSSTASPSFICLYGQSEASHEAPMAAEKLKRAGFADVRLLQGGLDAWKKADLPVEGKGGQQPQPLPPHGRKEIDLQESRLEWTGRNLLNKHCGKISLKSGHLDFDHGLVTGGEVLIDMTAITCDDLQGNPLHDVLIHHLRSDDFFDTDLHPEARITIREAKPTDGGTPGSPNLQVKADLTLKGITAPVEFTASAGIDDQGRPAAQAAFAIDRTRWHVLYGSGRFFARLAGHLVNDLIELQIRLVCKT
ncbi:YceI family protein [Brevifollis gellanilyticus]|uniref:Sulfurtransferase n=1 Tax=Brevifollis gellanilyticus TaxID=748831 RepID=A0A512MFA1_9BACT|nr:YceI family protein [Brevifollis gellanilyticus]GEP45398.1 sulfurtransferase [Brevifollis gellanilyticus]